MLDLTIQNYVKGIHDPTLRLKMIKYPTKSQRSLHGAFLKAKAEAKQIQAEKDGVDAVKAEAEDGLFRKMREHVLNGQTMPQQLVHRLRESTKEEMVPLYYPKARLTIEPPSRVPTPPNRSASFNLPNPDVAMRKRSKPAAAPSGAMARFPYRPSAELRPV